MEAGGARWNRRIPWRTASLAIAATAILGGCTASGTQTTVPSPTPVTEASDMVSDRTPAVGLVLASTAFTDGAPIPVEHSCRGADISPPLAWSGVPSAAGALVLIVDDPDGRDWVHWSVLDLTPRDGSLAAGILSSADPPQQGRNDFGRYGYGGPCPPSGTHHYRFTLYALAAPLGLAGHPDGATVRDALARATILAQTTLVGTFRA
jgi:Raf kinase inhibitor-like YbhB/YbcL family protein